MHEMSLVRNVVDMVVEEAVAAGAPAVRSVSLVIGYGRDIVEDLFEGLFERMTRGTVAEGAELIIRRVPFTVLCNRCGQVYHIDTRDEDTWACFKCGERDYKLNSGMEFFIDSIAVVGRSDTQ